MTEKQEIASKLNQQILNNIGFNENASSTDDIIKNDIQNKLSRKKAINGFKKIKDIRSRPGQEFCVMAYFLTDKISPEGSRGMWFLVGTFPQPDMAIKEAESLIRKTGINSIYAMQTCDWQEINDVFKPNRIKFVPPDRDNKLEEQHKEEY